MALSLATTDGPCGTPDLKAQAYFAQALKYLQNSPTARSILTTAQAAATEIQILIHPNANPMFIHPQTAQCYGYPGALVLWNPTAKTLAHTTTGQATFQSPAIALTHELGHALQWIKHTAWYLSVIDIVMRGNSNHHGTSAYAAKRELENHNICTYETQTASELGEGTRKHFDHITHSKQANQNYRAPYPLLPQSH